MGQLDITKLERDLDGSLPSYAWPGGYPLYYVSAEGETFCPACATRFADDVELREQEGVSAIADWDVNWEDAELVCEQCGLLIESAYGERSSESAGSDASGEEE